jgi:rod shape-determining protein MreC
MSLRKMGYVYVIENKRKKEKRQLETATTAPKK